MNLSGKTILVTGSTDGVGRLVAVQLASAGAHVLVHGRDVERGKRLVQDIQSRKGQATLYVQELASFANVRALAKDVLANHPRLDVLVNNAGIGNGGGSGQREVSRDGHELRFAVNYLAGFLLTHLLLERLVASAPARIVNVSSLGQQAIEFGDVMLNRDYSGVRAYRQSKLAQILFTLDLAEQLKSKGVTVTSLHPATFMNTTMVRQIGVTPVSTVEQGAEAMMQLIASPMTEGVTGVFYNGLKESRADPQAYDATARQRLWDLSAKLTGVGA